MNSGFVVLLTILPFVQSSCSDNKDCASCASSTAFFVKCRWCEMTKTCHTPGSPLNSCTGCTDSSISKLCSVTEAGKCNRHNQSESKSGDFEPYDAYKAVLYSAVAYANDSIQCAERMFKDEEFEIIELIGKECNYLFKYRVCFAYSAVSHTLKTIILAYRGTTGGKQLAEEFATVLGKFKVSARVGGNIQEYFSNANDQIYPCAKASMKDLVKQYPTYKVIVTGHSLGGAIASVATSQLMFDKVIDKEKTTLYTFGMPRTGDRTYAENFDKLVPKSWRIVHFRDAVPKLPLMTSLSGSPYHHQREIFYGADMSIISEYIECFDYEDEKCGRSVRASPWSVDYHRTYYGILVGGHCDEKVNKRNRRSTETADVSKLFTNTTCKRIKVSETCASEALRSVYIIPLSVVLMLFL